MKLKKLNGKIPALDDNMAKDRGSGKSDKRRDKGSGKSDKGKDKEKVAEAAAAPPPPPPPTPIERTINITIVNLQNVLKKEGTNVTASVQHDASILGESQPTRVEADCGDPPVIDINYNVSFTMTINRRSSINTVVSKPILITVLESTVDATEDTKSMKDREKATPTSKSKSTKTTVVAAPKVMGSCNLDLMPLLLGARSLTEKLLLESSIFPYGGTTVSWPNLPFLVVSMWTDDEEIFPIDMRVNFLNITVESLYNPPASFTDALDYRAATVAYVDSEIPEDVMFDGGKWSNVRDVERTKRWQTLNHVQGRASLSKYKLNCDKERVKNEFKKEFDPKKKLIEDAPRIEWNSMNRYMILHSGSQMMYEKINRYKCWPFQFIVAAREADASKGKSKDSIASQLFQCYADVTELVYPGNARTRVVAQLYTYSALAMAEKTGLERSIFEMETTKESKEKEKKGKPSTRAGAAAPPSAPGEVEAVPSFPVIAENGEPVFVIVEFELLRPLLEARDFEDLSDSIDQMVTKLVVPPYVYTGDLAEDHYFNCIRKLVGTIVDEYQNFIETPFVGEADPSEIKIDTSLCSEPSQPDEERKCKYAFIPDELSCFIQHLHSSGAYLAIRTTLRNKITTLLDQKFKVEFNTLEHKEWQNFVATAYIYLVENMHLALNKGVKGQLAKEHKNISTVNNISFYAEEAHVLGFVDVAKNYYLTMISGDGKNPDRWLEYAIFLIKINDMDRATECCREAVALDKTHKTALDVTLSNRLLLYGLVLVHKEEYRDAEIFLKAVTHLYPRFAEGWTILHMFYLRTEYFPGVDITIQIALKCMTDKDPDVITTKFLNRDPLPWTTFKCPKDRIYIVTAVLLIKMGCFDFAGVALAQELSLTGRSTPLLYYLAVHHYTEHRYADALSHLEEAVCQHGMDYAIGSLMGHCHREEGNFNDALYCYEFANNIFDRPEDLHLVQLRLGFHYIDAKEYYKAKTILLITCKNSPTSRTWLGVGIACYHLNRMKEAEAALSEANRLNVYDSEIWGYLCLLNMSLQRYDEFVQCYRQVVKNNLKNVNLWLMITELMEDLDYPTPVLSMNSHEDVGRESMEEEEVGEEVCMGGETPEESPPKTVSTYKKD